MKRSLVFYCDVLGFHIHSSAGDPEDLGWVWLKWNDADLMLNGAYEPGDRPNEPDPLRVTAHDDTCIYFGCQDVDGAYEYLRSKGMAIEPPTVAPYGMKQLYLHDPDGYNICFQWTA